MESETLQYLISLCRARLCKITLEVAPTGIVVSVTAERNMSIGTSKGLVAKQTSRWLDANDAEMWLKLEETTQMVQ